jgi:hypothetical protein
MRTIHKQSHAASIVATLLLFSVAAGSEAMAQSSPNFVLKKWTMSSGGGKASSPNFSLSSVVGQGAPQGNASSPSFKVDAGFFHPSKPPVADAGPDIVVECSSPAHTAVDLDGSASSGPDKETLQFAWTGTFGSAVGPTPTITLPLGSTTVTLVVKDGQVNSAPDTLMVKVIVRPAGFESPLASLVTDGPPPLPAKAFRQGRTLPLKLRLFCGSVAVTEQDGVPAPKIVALSRMGAPVSLETTDLDAGEANDSGLSFRSTDDGSWVYNLSTKGLSAGSYLITIELPDGRRFSGAFDLK